MFRILSHFVHFIGTVFLIFGVACQVYSITSTEWIVHKLTSDNGLSYFEGMRFRNESGVMKVCSVFVP